MPKLLADVADGELLARAGTDVTGKTALEAIGLKVTGTPAAGKVPIGTDGAGNAAWGVPAAAGAVGGDLSGTIASASAIALHAGATRLTYGAVPQNGYLRRSGTTIVGDPGLDIEVAFFASGVLNTSNFEAALIAAIAFAYAQPTGGTVRIPAGSWPMSQAIALPAGTRDQAIMLRGAGRYSTILYWPAEFADACITVDGSAIDVDHENFFWGGVCDLTIAGDYADCAATGLLITKAIMSEFRNIAIEGFLGAGGMGLNILANEDGNNSQNLLFDNVHLSLNDQGSRFKAITGFMATHIHWNNNQTLDHEWGGFCSGTINGYMFQSGAIPSMQTSNPNPGGNRITFEGQGYHEASSPFSPYLLKTLAPTETYDWFSFGDGVSANGYVKLFDLTGTSYLRLGHVTAAPETSTWVKAVNCGTIILDDAPPGSVDGDNYSNVSLSRAWLGLPTFGQLSNGESIEAILTPKAAEGWDLGKRATLVLANNGTEVASVTGLVHGTVAAPGTMGNPKFNPASKHSNYQAAVQLTENVTTGKGLKATLGTPIPVGTYVGIFVVMRCQDTGPAINIRGPFIRNAGTGVGYGIGAADLTRSTEIYGQFTVGGTDRPIGPAAGQTVHAILIQPDFDKLAGDVTVHNALYVDNATRIITGNAAQAPTTGTLSTLWFAGIDDKSANLTIYELWFLNKNLSAGEIAQLMDLAREKYGIPQTVTTATPVAAPALVKGPAASTIHALAAFAGTSGDELEASAVLGAGVATFLATPSSANLAAAVTDEAGAGALYFTGGALGTPASANLGNATALPISTGVAGLGTGVAAFLATPTSANLATAVSDELGTGKVLFAAAPAVAGQILQSDSVTAQTFHYPGDCRILDTDAVLNAANTLTDVTGMAIALQPGTYRFEAELEVFQATNSADLRMNLTFSGTVTSNRIYPQENRNVAIAVFVSIGAGATISTAITATTSRGPRLTGWIVVSVAGTLQLQLCTTAATGTLKAGSYMRAFAGAPVH